MRAVVAARSGLTPVFAQAFEQQTWRVMADKRRRSPPEVNASRR